MSHDVRVRERPLEQVLRDLGVLDEEDTAPLPEQESEDYTTVSEQEQLHGESQSTTVQEEAGVEESKIRSLTHALLILSQYVSEDTLLDILRRIDIGLILEDLEHAYPEVSSIVKLILKAHGIVR